MDPITIIGLGAKVVDILALYVKKGAEKFVKEVDVAACEKAESLLKTLKMRLSGDQTATDMLGEFEKDPDTYRTVIEKILNKKVEQDKDLAAELARHLEDIPNLKIIQEMDVAKEVKGGKGDLKRGKAEVVQKAKHAEKMTGWEGNIG